jgi:hypothetical protein
MTPYKRQFSNAIQVFDSEDRYARERGVRGPHPRPLGSVRFYAVGQVINDERQDFHQPLELIVRRNPGGYFLFFGHVRLPNGATRQHILDDGTYVVRVESTYYQQMEREDVDIPLVDPEAPVFWDLSPGYTYPFPKTSTLPGGLGPTLLRGGVLDAGGEWLAGVVMEVLGQPDLTYLTDASGQWVLAFPDSQTAGSVTVRFTARDGSSEDVDATIEPGRETSLPPLVLP